MTVVRVHLRLALILIAAAVAGCPARAPTPAPTSTSAATAASPAPSPTAADQRCLPVVAADCGCVYACGLGTRAGDRWSVTHPSWTSPITATIAPWCVDGQCTDAFHGEIVCSGICAPRPADPTCHLDAAGTCVGGAP